MVKPPLRTKSIGFKVSEEEYARLETAAQASGRTLGEWCRWTKVARRRHCSDWFLQPIQEHHFGYWRVSTSTDSSADTTAARRNATRAAYLRGNSRVVKPARLLF